MNIQKITYLYEKTTSINIISNTHTWFILSRFNKMKNREIAELLGISVSMVEKHIRKALAAFSQAIDQSTPLLMILVSIWSMTGGPWE